MFLALAVLLFQIPATPQASTPQASNFASAPVQSNRTVSALSSKLAAAQAETASKPARQDAEPFVNRSSRNLPTAFHSADETRTPWTPVQPGTVKPAADGMVDSSADPFTPGSSSAASPGVSPAPDRAMPLPAAKVSLFLVGSGAPRPPRLWYALAAAGHGAATFDAWSTRRLISSGTGRELDPLLRPFASNASLYAAVQAWPGLLDLLSKGMLRSERGWVRRMWWVPQVLGTAGSLWSGAHNLGVACRPTPAFSR